MSYILRTGLILGDAAKIFDRDKTSELFLNFDKFETAFFICSQTKLILVNKKHSVNL